MKNPFLILILTIIIAGCQYRNEEELYPGNEVCDTTGVTYSGTVLPILVNNCYSCHNAAQSASSGGGLNLQDFSLLKALAEEGNLYGALSHNPLYPPMPKGRAQLDSCSLARIKVWIDSGTPEN